MILVCHEREAKHNKHNKKSSMSVTILSKAFKTVFINFMSIDIQYQCIMNKLFLGSNLSTLCHYNADRDEIKK